MRVAAIGAAFSGDDVPASLSPDPRPAFCVRVGFEIRAGFDELRDAIQAARLMKLDDPTRGVAVVDIRSGLFVIDIE